MFKLICPTHSVANRYSDYAPIVIRLILAAIFIVHGGQKLFGLFGGSGIEGTIGFFASQGIEPALFFAWLVALVEFFGGIAMIIGLLTRIFAIALTIDMLVAMTVVHFENGFLVNKGGVEFTLAILGLSISLILIGSKKWSLDNWLCKKFCR